MFEFLIYELKVAAILAAFYLCFKSLLCREKMHRMNRIVLILTSVLSFILPLCIITVHKTVPMSQVFESGVIESVDSEVEPVVFQASSSFPWETVAVCVYLVGVLTVLVSVVLGIRSVVKLINSGENKYVGDTEVIVCDGNVPPFSWMKWIVMSKMDFESGNSHIVEHEKAHIRLGHSKDVLLVDILSSLQWFNPAIWLLKADLRAIHEYEADDAVLRNGANIKEYQYSLIRKAVSASGYSITNSFNHSILKNRITMMSKSNASWMRWLRALYILPLVCGTLALNARTIIDYESSEIPSIAQKPVRVEVKMEKGQPAIYVEGQKTDLDKVEERVSSLNKDKSIDSVELVVDGNVQMGSVTDLKDIFRKLDILKISSMEVTPKSTSSTSSQQPQKKANEAVPSKQTESVAFQLVETKPSFNGGDANEFSKWVNSNLKYPADAKTAGIQGRVTLTFTVSETGKVKDVKVLRGVDPSLDAEALRVVSASPDWTPGKSQGKNVSVTYTFPVIFQLPAAKTSQAEGTIEDVTVVAYGDKKKALDLPTTNETPVNFSELTKKPSFNGGDANEFAKWVNAHLIYPDSARSAGIQGRVAVKFKVNANGKVSDISVISGVCDAINDEAIRLVSSAPDWTPGELNGKAVATTYVFSILFQIR